MKMNRALEPMNAVINDFTRDGRLKQPHVVVKEEGARACPQTKIAPEEQLLSHYKSNQNLTPHLQMPKRRIYQLASGLKEIGHSIFLVRPVQVSTTSDTLAEQTMLVKGFAIPRYKTLQFGAPAYANLKAFFIQQKPDVVHIVTEGPLGLAALYAARHLGIPVTSGFHSPFHEFSKYFGLSFLLTPIIAYLRYFHNRTAMTCVPSEKTVTQLNEMGIDRLAVVSRGVDVERFNPAHRRPSLRQTWGAGEQTTVLLYVGRLSPEKKIELVNNPSVPSAWSWSVMAQSVND
jgi:glycosyltransferase involved in cell wall biosynthesis